MRQCLFILALLIGAPPAFATWNWVGGDFVSYTLYPPNQLPHRFQEAIDTHLDYRFLYAPPTEGHFVGLADFLQEEEFNNPHILTPILGTAVFQDSAVVICVGIDPRSPIPNTSLHQWAPSQGGVAILTHLPPPTLHTHLSSDTPTLFQALDTTGWHPQSHMGGRWDSLLTQGHRIGIVGNQAPSSHTYIWAETTHPHHLFAGLNNLSTIVSEANAIQADFRIDGHVPGTLFLPEAHITLRLSANAQAPIEHVRLISDGEEIWSATPHSTTFITRIQLPTRNKSYIRAEFQTQSHITRTSPIFFESEFSPESFDISFAPLPLHQLLDGVIESLTYLSTPSQARVLAEYLANEQTRFALAQTLENRPDILSEGLLETLMASPFPQVRLGTAFLYVMHNTSDLTPYLQHLLSDPDPAIQTYAARMILQYTPRTYAPQMKDWIATLQPAARTYLIYALDATDSDPAICRTLIHQTRNPEPSVAHAATVKLVEMGNRNFRIIRTLRDSAQAGHITSLKILGTIGDERTLKDIEKMYLQAPPSPFKNVAFHVLQTFYPEEGHYPQRPEIHDQGAYPLIDGQLLETEWTGAAHLNRFVNDAHTGAYLDGLEAWFTRDATHLFFAAKIPTSTSTHPFHILLATTLAPQIPFEFTILHPTQNETLPDPALDLHHQLTPTHWIVEGAIALTDLGLDPIAPIPYLHLDVTYKTDDEQWRWAPTYGMPDNAQQFGLLHLHTP